MSGVDSATSTPSLPPTDTGPPPELPTGVEAPHHEHGAIDLAVEVGVHLAGGVGSMCVEWAGVGVTGAAAVLAPALEVAASALTIYGTFEELGTVLTDADAAAILEYALGGDGSPTSRAYGAGMGCVLLGMTGDEIVERVRTMPDDTAGLRDAFVAGATHALRTASDTPGWSEAREAYRDVHRAWADGVAAAIGGWDTPGRSAVFAHARAEMSAYLDAHPAEAAALRTEYAAHVRDGFRHADDGRIDEHRYELDAGYRCGVEHRRSLEGAALDEARHDIVGTTASSFTLGHITG